MQRISIIFTLSLVMLYTSSSIFRVSAVKREDLIVLAKVIPERLSWGENAEIAVSLENNATEPIHNITVAIHGLLELGLIPIQDSIYNISKLSSWETRTVLFPVKAVSEVAKTGSIFVEVFFENYTINERVDVEISEPQMPLLNLPESIAIGIVSGGFAILGVVVGLIFNYFMNKASRRFEWSRYLIEKHSDDYKSLHEIVASGVDSTLIEDKYRSIKGNVFLPRSVSRQYNELISILKGQKSEETKRKARESFLETLEDFLRKPWEYL